MQLLPIKRALLSVTDKSGLVEFATFLAEQGVELVSTGGTRKKLADAGLNVISVSEVTGFPEIMGGRVKTLHPHVHGGILADKDNPEHLSTLADLGIKTFDLICVNLYNFAEAARKGLELRDAVEQIDIGGPCMLRATAKNFHSMAVVPGVQYYERIMEAIQKDGGLDLALRKEMAVETFRQTSEYDAMITDYLASHDA